MWEKLTQINTFDWIIRKSYLWEGNIWAKTCKYGARVSQLKRATYPNAQLWEVSDIQEKEKESDWRWQSRRGKVLDTRSGDRKGPYHKVFVARLRSWDYIVNMLATQNSLLKMLLMLRYYEEKLWKPGCIQEHQVSSISRLCLVCIGFILKKALLCRDKSASVPGFYLTHEFNNPTFEHQILLLVHIYRIFIIEVTVGESNGLLSLNIILIVKWIFSTPTDRKKSLIYFPK